MVECQWLLLMPEILYQFWNVHVFFSDNYDILHITWLSVWWFQLSFMFTSIWGTFPFWLRGRNQQLVIKVDFRSINHQQKYVRFLWSNYSDLTRPHPKWWLSKGNPLISGKPRLVKYYNLARISGDYAAPLKVPRFHLGIHPIWKKNGLKGQSIRRHGSAVFWMVDFLHSNCSESSSNSGASAFWDIA